MGLSLGPRWARLPTVSLSLTVARVCPAYVAFLDNKINFTCLENEMKIFHLFILEFQTGLKKKCIFLS